VACGVQCPSRPLPPCSGNLKTTAADLRVGVALACKCSGRTQKSPFFFFSACAKAQRLRPAARIVVAGAPTSPQAHVALRPATKVMCSVAQHHSHWGMWITRWIPFLSCIRFALGDNDGARSEVFEKE